MADILPGWLQPFGRPIAPIYERIIRARNRRFDNGVGIARVDLPVISVGNITVGGTGKTPMVRWIARELLDAGHQPCIAMRGYGAKRGEVGDEQAEYMDALPDVPVIADPDRAGALTARLSERPEVDCVLLDDGFQHRQLDRDLDLVLIDASRETMRDRMLPAGSLREPLASLARADAVILTRVDAVDPPQIDMLESRIGTHHGKRPIAHTTHAWSGLNLHGPSGSRATGLDWLDGKRLLTMLGVGNPRSIEQQIHRQGGKIAVSIPAGDHERYDRAKITSARILADGVDPTFMTGKDWVKARQLIDLQAWPTPVVVPELQLQFETGLDAMRVMLVSCIRAASQPDANRRQPVVTTH